jgi:hypothetical protein
LLEVLRLIVEEDAIARRIATETDARAELSYINRIKAGAIVNWVKAHPIKAPRAVARQGNPRDFPATSGGRVRA